MKIAVYGLSMNGFKSTFVAPCETDKTISLDYNKKEPIMTPRISTKHMEGKPK